MSKQTHATKWHQIFGAVLQEHLGPMGIEVIPDFKVSPEPPEADILLLQQSEHSGGWTTEQLARLRERIRTFEKNRAAVETCAEYQTRLAD